MLAYQIYHKLKEYREFSLQINSLKVVVTLALLIYILGFTLVPWFMVERKVLVIALIILCLPFLLEFQNTFKFDRILGELSYPIYVVHILCIEAGSYWLELPTENLSVQTYLVYLGIIIVSAFVLDLAISKPLESVRRKYRRRNS
jgi:peptidoglycan/LPS O-acetylase OafA/YrhL